MSSQPKLNLYYFQGKGRGECARYICAAGGLQFTDTRVEMKDWGTLKATLPFGQLPVLEVDGVKVNQSGAICRYLAELAGLLGETPVERVQIDALADTVLGLAENAVPAFFEGADVVVKKDQLPKLEEDIKATLQKLEAQVKGNFFFGDKLTLADIRLLDSADFLKIGFPEGLLDGFPRLKGIEERVARNPGISAYIKSRPAGMW